MTKRTFAVVNSPEGTTSADVELDHYGEAFLHVQIDGDDYELVDGEYVYIP